MTAKKKHANEEEALLKCVCKCADQGRLAFNKTSGMPGADELGTFQAQHGKLRLTTWHDAATQAGRLKVEDDRGVLLDCWECDTAEGHAVGELYKSVRHAALDLDNRLVAAQAALKHDESPEEAPAT